MSFYEMVIALFKKREEMKGSAKNDITACVMTGCKKRKTNDNRNDKNRISKRKDKYSKLNDYENKKKD